MNQMIARTLSTVLKRACGSLTAALLLTVAQPAFANSPPPSYASYAVAVDGNEVTICPKHSYGQLEFPDGSEMLRRDTRSGDLALLGDVLDEQGCFVDPCVPEGKYQYGLAEPFSCQGHESIDLFVETWVVDPLDPQCEPLEGFVEAQPFEGVVPWSDDEPEMECPGDQGDTAAGCSVAGVPSTLWGPYALVFLAGLALTGVSRRRRRRSGQAPS